MIVLDTHTWLWWNSDPDKLSTAAKAALDSADDVGLCPISCWELAMKVARRRLTLDRDVQSWVAKALARPPTRLLPLTAEIAVTAGLIDARTFHGDPADRLLVATAQVFGAELVTKDRLIRSYPHVKTVW